MSPKDFKKFFLDSILDFLWRQWSALGVAGSARAGDTWVIDPETLLVFSLEFARYEPRIFDEILDWLCTNGKWIDIQRLRGILKTKDEKTKRLMSAVAGYVSHEAKTYQRKWQTLALANRAVKNREDEILFRTKEGIPYPEPQRAANIFHSYGFLRETFVRRKMSRPVSVAAPGNIRFLLRSLFGLGSRSECILYLLTHEAGHPTDVAGAIGFSVRGTQDALIDLVESGLVLTRPKGRRKKEYRLSSQKRWWEFFSGMSFEEVKIPVWLDWISLYSALMKVWNALNEIEEAKSDYLRSSKLREAMEMIGLEFSRSGLELPAIPGREVRPEKFEEAFRSFIERVLGVKRVWGVESLGSRESYEQGREFRSRK